MPLLPVYLDDKETAQLSTERPGMSEPFVSSGADESVQKVRGIDVSLSGPSIRQLSETHAAVLQVPCKHLKKTDRVSRPFFKNRKFTVDVGKMWPDCNVRLSYFNLRAVSTFFCDLLRSLMDCRASVSPSRAQPTKPHLLWRLGLTSKQALDPHGPHV